MGYYGAVSTYLSQPKVIRALHGWSIIMWAAVWVVASEPVFAWVESIRFISHVTMATALLTSFAAWCAARVEVRQEEQES